MSSYTDIHRMPNDFLSRSTHQLYFPVFPGDPSDLTDAAIETSASLLPSRSDLPQYQFGIEYSAAPANGPTGPEGVPAEQALHSFGFGYGNATETGTEPKGPLHSTEYGDFGPQMQYEKPPCSVPVLSVAENVAQEVQPLYEPLNDANTGVMGISAASAASATPVTTYPFYDNLSSAFNSEFISVYPKSDSEVFSTNVDRWNFRSAVPEVPEVPEVPDVTQVSESIPQVITNPISNSTNSIPNPAQQSTKAASITNSSPPQSSSSEIHIDEQTKQQLAKLSIDIDALRRQSAPRRKPSGRPKPDSLRVHPCELCGKRFFRLEHVRRHMTCHTDAKPFVCIFPNCGKRFTRQDNLKSHMKNSHLGRGRRR